VRRSAVLPVLVFVVPVLSSCSDDDGSTAQDDRIFVANSCPESRDVEIFGGAAISTPNASGPAAAGAVTPLEQSGLSEDDDLWTFVILGEDGANVSVEVDPSTVQNRTLLIAALGC